MHTFEWNHRRDALAPHRFQGTASVAHVIARETAAHEIGDAAGDSFHHRISALGAIAADQISTARDFPEQPRNVGRIILQIAVDKDDDLAARGLQAGVEGRALASILLET